MKVKETFKKIMIGIEQSIMSVLIFSAFIALIYYLNEWHMATAEERCDYSNTGICLTDIEYKECIDSYMDAPMSLHP